MSISLKNITAADTISSLVDKINYNFDQIVMNGGGIEGPKGDIGYPGMQGITGEQGAKGDQGNQGIRGSVWHLLNPTTEINENTRLDDPTDPDHKDPSGIPYQDNDMLLVLKMSDNSTSDKVIDSIWNVMYDENTDGYYPVNEQRIMTLDFFQQIPNADDNPNSIIRTAPSTNGRRGIVLNDYNGNINNISSTLVDDIIQHNIILIYTEAPEDAGEGSPNCGIVFYKNNSDDVLGDTGSDSGVGRMPRINYVVSQDERIKYLNICAPEQSLILKSKNDIKINSTEGVISCRINSNIQQNSNSTTRFELYKYDENTANKESYIELNYNNDISELNLSGNNIFLKNINANKNWIKIFDIPNILSSCNILLENDNNCIDFDKILSVGKNGMYTPLNPYDPTDNYYDQARIVLNNDDNAVKEIVLIGSKITAGKLPSSMSYNDETIDGTNRNFNKFGMYIEKEHLSLCSTKKYINNSLTHTYYSQIKLNAEANGRNNITLSTTYPGVIEMSNVSGLYNSSIINYTDSSIDYSQKFIYAAPMGDKIISNNRYKYANCNFYKNLNIKNVNNIGAMYAGTTIFNGKYSDSSATVNDKLVYNFIRIGNVVHCTFSGVIDTSKICARTSDTPNIVLRSTNNYLADESYYKCNDSTYISEWTSPTYSQQYGSTTSTATVIGTGSINLATLNFIYLYLYPPIIRLTYKNNVYSTGVKNLIGHLTYSENGSIYEKSLSYSDSPTELSTNNNFIKIPHIKIFNMKNSVSNQFYVLNNSGIGSANSSTVNIAFNDFALNGTFTTKLVEIYGEFSYLLDIEYNPLLNHIHHKEDLFIPWIENDSSEGGEAPINSGSTTTNGDSGTTTNTGGNTNQEENISSDINP